MILDKEMLFADDLAYGGTPEILDLGPVNAGKGEPIRVFFTTNTALTACTGIIVTHDDNGDVDEDLMTWDNADVAVVGTYEFHLPSTTKRYVTIALEGTVSAGTFSSGIVLGGVQTNK